MINLPLCNITTLRYIQWEQNTVTPLAAVHLDWLENNGNTFVNKYMWNCGSCSFIVIQILPHLRQNNLKVIINFVQQVRWSVTIICWFLHYVLDEISDVSEESATHVNACEPKLHPEIGSNICQRNIRTLSYNKKCKTEKTTKSRNYFLKLYRTLDYKRWKNWLKTLLII